MNSEIFAIVLAVFAAAAAGLVGAFALMRRLALAGDVISHIALPGIGLAILYKINPLLGGAITLFLGILLIWQLERKTGLSTDVTIGAIFAGSLAIGALITPKEELIEALFGGFGKITAPEFIIGMALVALVVYYLWKLKDGLILTLFSPELAAASGVKLQKLNLYFLLIFGLSVILGLRFLGALLMGSLIILPAAAARQLAHTLKSFLTVSSIISAVSMIAGLTISNIYDIELGPTVTLVAASILAFSVLKKNA